ncbi:MAG: hypothetical protein ACJAT6_000710 [Akkermansiaceae bacterium]
MLSRDGPKPEHWDSLPTPTDAQNARDGQALEDFLDWAIWPKLKRKSNTAERNPWKSEIEASSRRPSFKRGMDSPTLLTNFPLSATFGRLSQQPNS